MPPEAVKVVRIAEVEGFNDLRKVIRTVAKELRTQRRFWKDARRVKPKGRRYCSSELELLRTFF